MLLLPDHHVVARRSAAAGPLARLARSLADDLQPLLARGPRPPEEKALLSKAGGTCERCRAALAFDPESADIHRCPECGREHRGAVHRRWWATWYHLWLAERAVHGAMLWRLTDDVRHRELARDILEGYAERYLRYPNRDNVLGPTRLFFSTYLESIWLLQVCLATDALQDEPLADRVRDRVIEPSRSLVGLFDEGISNRQVWNNAALLAAARLVGDEAAGDRLLGGASGLLAHLRQGLLADGTWYEGENYHLFAHRGLWYGVMLAETAGAPLPDDGIRRFQEGFATPFLTALPDFTMPSRKDSQYAVSLRQWRTAEWLELGLARRDDPRLRSALARLYDDDAPDGRTGRARSTADVERNHPPARLTRADLGWRALLLALPDLPELRPEPPPSVNLRSQGITVVRRGDVYVALDWGATGGGHGHPDRLNLLFAHGGTRWLDDMGTGSYVERTLHWYRSTLAHSAPLVNGRSQERVAGRQLVFTDDPELTTVVGGAVLGGVSIVRTVLVTGSYFVDDVRWQAGVPVRFDLPVHLDGVADNLDLAPGTLDGGAGLEDGFDFVRDVTEAGIPPREVVTLEARRDRRACRAWCWSPEPTRWFRAVGPGQPAERSRPFHIRRGEGREGCLRAVWTWSDAVSSVRFLDDAIEVNGTRHEIPDHPMPTPERSRQSSAQRTPPHPVPAGFTLEAPHYRRSEESWEEAGRPSARAGVNVEGRTLLVETIVPGPVVFVPPDAINPYDNEHPDINAHGVQLYVRVGDAGGAWIAVPEPGLRSGRIRRLAGWGELTARGTWRPEGSGFAVRLEVPLPGEGEEVALDVLVNETAPGRDRRRGQLVLSGAEGEWVYLRGDRHDPARLVRFAIPS